MRTTPLTLLLLAVLALPSCRKETSDPTPTTPQPPSGPRLVMKFKFDSTQVRLDNFGAFATIPPGHAAQSPRFNAMSAHYVEFTPDAFTPLGSGAVVYHAPETSAGGSMAIDFGQGVRVGDGGTFLSIPLSELPPGTYEWLRVSLAYQNYDIRFRASGMMWAGTVASFIGYNTYLASFRVKDSTVTVNGNRSQGYWAFEMHDPPFAVPVQSGQTPGTTVPNPIHATSPIPAGSCVVTGSFPTPLRITGSEAQDVVVVVSLSTNKSFEWTDAGNDGIYDPLDGDTVVDMGVRGMVPIVQ